jgi:hypothetical protein
MSVQIRFSAVLLSLSLAVPAGAAAISGSVFEDTRALANHADFAPRAGVTVRAFRDGGDGLPNGADDKPAGEAVTAANGVYEINVAGNGLYWIAVDSHSINASSATTGNRAWAEQTFGPAGALCEDGNGATKARTLAGPCYGGRSRSASDNAAALATSEHVASVRVNDDAAVRSVDFAFSFDVVTTTTDGDGIQGSLRQFLANANAIGGANSMRFVPLDPLPPAKGREPQHWVIHLAKPLPPITDDGTAINGTAYRFTNGTPVILSRQEIDVNDEAGTQRPEIDLFIELAGDDGLVFERRGAIRSAGLSGAKTAIRAKSDVTIERSMIEGGAPAPSPVGAAGAAGAPVPATLDGIVITHGMLAINRSIITGLARYAITVDGDATFDAGETEITFCGSPTSGGAIILHTSGSTISRCFIHRNGGPGIELDAPSNTIDSTRLVDNWIGIVLRARATQTTIARNDLIWNRSGAIVSSEASSGPAKHNRITRNHFNENGGEAIAVGQIVEDETRRRTPACNADAIGTIDAPYIEHAEKVGDGDTPMIDVEGVACPNSSVEVYTSFVTGSLRHRIEQNERDLYSVREALKARNVIETRDDQGLNTQRLPSVGEFNYAGMAVTDASGHFKLRVPWPQQSSATVTFQQNSGGLSVAAISIDTPGNTSPFSGRKLVAGANRPNNRS